MASKKQLNEFYTNGKIDLERIGNMISVRSRFTEEELHEHNKRIAADLNLLKQDINDLVKKIVEKSRSCDPLHLMLAATDITQMSMCNKVSEIQMGQEIIGILHLIEYIQSVFVSYPYDESLVDEEKEFETTMEIFKDIDDLFYKCINFYMSWAANEHEKDELKQEEIDYILEHNL